MAKRKKRMSRADRWYDACGRAAAARDSLVEAADELRAIQEEYEEWNDNLPENLRSSALGDKLEEVVNNLDIDTDGLDWIDEAEGKELPMGFGRD